MNMKLNGPLVRQRARAKTATVAFPLDSSILNASSMPDLFLSTNTKGSNSQRQVCNITNKSMSNSMSSFYKSNLGYPPPPPLNPKLRVLQNTISERRAMKQTQQSEAITSFGATREIPIIEKPKPQATLPNHQAQLNKPKRTVLNPKKLNKSINVKIPKVNLLSSEDNLQVETTSTKQNESKSKKFLSENLIHRTKEEKESSPDSFYCDKRGFKEFPTLCSEDSNQLKLLSLQNNFIRRIDNLSYLNNLIVLDLYNNRIERIAGLQVLQSLRVLLLGKNRIRRLDGLENLKRLEILDLHGNQLRYIENCLNSCVCLRVLNLAGNIIRSLRNLGGMNALTELNLKRNRIKSLDGLQKCLYIKKLLLANNEIQSFSSLTPLKKLSFLQELLLESNPISSLPNYTDQVILLLPWILTFDNNGVTDSMKADAKRWFKEKQSLELEQQRKAIEEKVRSSNSTREEIINEAKRRWENLKSYVKLTTTNSEVKSSSLMEEEAKLETVCIPQLTSSGISAVSLENAASVGKVEEEIETAILNSLSPENEIENVNLIKKYPVEQGKPVHPISDSEKEEPVNPVSALEKESVNSVSALEKEELVNPISGPETAVKTILHTRATLSPSKNPLEKLTKIAVVKPSIRKPPEILNIPEVQHPDLQHHNIENIVLEEKSVYSSSQTLSSSEDSNKSKTKGFSLMSQSPNRTIKSSNPLNETRKTLFRRSFSSSTLSRATPFPNISESSSVSSSNVNISGIKPNELSKVEHFLVKEKQNSTGNSRKKSKPTQMNFQDTISSSSSDSDDDDESTNTSDMSGRRPKKIGRMGHVSGRRGRLKRGQTAIGPKSFYSYSSNRRPFTGIKNSPRNLRRYDSLTNLEQLTPIPASTVLKKQGSDYLIEIDGKALNLFGPGSLKHFLTCFSTELNNSVNTIKFHFLSFDSIAPYFPKLKKYYSGLDHFHFRSTNICYLGQLNGLADLQGLSSLYISQDGNPICENALWKEYAFYRLGHWGLKDVNGDEAATSDLHKSFGQKERNEKSDQFDALGYLALSCLPQSALTPLAKRLHALHSFACCSASSSSGDDSGGRKKLCESEGSGSICTSWDDDPILLDVIGKEALGYVLSQPSSSSTRTEDAILTKILNSGKETIQKLDMLEELWPSIVTEAIQDILVEFRYMDNYAKKELRKLKDTMTSGSSNTKDKKK